MSENSFTLAYPFEFKGKKYDTLDGRRPTVRDMRKFIKNLDKDSVEAMEIVLADLFQVDQPVIGNLDIADYAPMQAWFQDFLKPLKTDSEA